MQLIKKYMCPDMDTNNRDWTHVESFAFKRFSGVADTPIPAL